MVCKKCKRKVGPQGSVDRGLCYIHYRRKFKLDDTVVKLGTTLKIIKLEKKKALERYELYKHIMDFETFITCPWACRRINNSYKKADELVKKIQNLKLW